MKSTREEKAVTKALAIQRKKEQGGSLLLGQSLNDPAQLRRQQLAGNSPRVAQLQAMANRSSVVQRKANNGGLPLQLNSGNWANKGTHLFVPNGLPQSIASIRTELGSAHTPVDKLLAIRNEVHGKTGFSLNRRGVTQRFYRILAQIPANVNVFEAHGTAAAVNRTIALQLQTVRRELQAFTS